MNIKLYGNRKSNGVSWYTVRWYRQRLCAFGQCYSLGIEFRVATAMGERNGHNMSFPIYGKGDDWRTFLMFSHGICGVALKFFKLG